MTKWIRNILFISTIILLGCNQEPSASELYDQAEKFENQSKYEEAIPLLEKAIEIDSTFLGAYINLGADYSDLGQFNKAIEIYKRVLKIDSFNELALFNIGKNYVRLKEYRKAVKYFSEILTDKNGNPKAEVSLTDLNGNTSGYHVPFNEVTYERASALYELKSYDSALVDFKSCTEYNDMIIESNYMCGAIYEMHSMKEKACLHYSIAANLGDQLSIDAVKRVCDK